MHQAPSAKQQATSHKLQAASVKIMIDIQDKVGYGELRTAAGDPAVIGNGNGPIGIGSMRALRDPGGNCIVKMSSGRCDLELPGLWPQATSSLKQQASSTKPLEVVDTSIKP